MLIHGWDFVNGERVPIAVNNDGTPATASAAAFGIKNVNAEKATLDGLIMLANDQISSPTVPQQVIIDAMIAARDAL